MTQYTGCSDLHLGGSSLLLWKHLTVLCVVTQAVEQFGIHICYGDLLHSMHRALKSMKSGGGGGGGMSGLLNNGFSMDGILMVSELHHSGGGAMLSHTPSVEELRRCSAFHVAVLLQGSDLP